MKVPFFDLGPQYSLLEGEIKSALEEVFRSQQFILGPKVEALEKAIAQYSKAKYAIGVASGSDALLLALMALDIGRGDEVILPTFSFFATAGVISRVGATPVFADIDPQTYNMDPSKVEAKITPRTKAIIPVHLFGQCADMNPLLELSKARRLFVIEDAAQALGSEYRPSSRSESLRAGEMGDLGCFSFYPTKNLGAFGDAGMVVTNNAGLADKVRILRVHGSQPKYYHKFVGINSRLDAVQAAVLLVKLNHLDQWTRARQGLAERYQKLFEGLALSADGFQLPKVQYRNRHIYNQYVIRVPQRDRLKKFLAESGIGTDIYYPLPLHLQECYASLNYRRGDLPVSEKASEEVLALPIYPELTEGQQGMVVERIRAFYKKTN